MGKPLVAGLVMLGAMTAAHTADFSCDARLTDMPEANCNSLVGDLVTKRFKEKYPSNTYQLVLMAGSGDYPDGSLSGYVLAGVAPIVGDQYPQDPVVIQFREPQTLQGNALFTREKTLLRSAVGKLMQNLGVAATSKKK